MATFMMDPIQLSARAGDAPGKARAGMLDTRPYQDLEPLQLPSKLRDRIARVQRRAAAEKDGVSIFTATTNAILAASEEAGPQTPETSIQRRQTRRDSNLQVSSSLTMAKDKMHLPEVVLSHKMREFEAKMNVNALFVDPRENSLHHLSIENKEHVMLKMQAKIQAITADVDAHFVTLKRELDANGIFDSAANYQRAQALCLVELQKRCKLEKIRDDATREVLGLDGDTGPTAMSHMEGKLNELLSRGVADDEDAALTSARRRRVAVIHQLQRNTKSSMAKRRPTVSHRALSPLKHQHLVSQKATPSSNQQADAEANSVTTGSSRLRPLEDTPIATGGAPPPPPPAEDWTTRHPHVAHALQMLSASGGGVPPPSVDSLELSSSSPHSTTTCGRIGESGAMEEGTPRSFSGSGCLTLAEEWAERSASYKTIAQRVGEELRHMRTRERWDSTQHFTSLFLTAVAPGKGVVERIRRSQATPSARRSEEEEKRQRELQKEVTNAERNKTAASRYAQARELIQSKRQHVAAHANSSPTAGSRVPRPASTATRRGGLVGSASAPTLGRVEMVEDTDGATHRTLVQGKKLSVLLDRKRSSRLRGDSLIGAPVATDLMTLGHHSNARIEERRQSAQTWAWLHHEGRRRGTPAAIDPVMEERSDTSDDDDDDDADDDDDERRDTVGSDDGGGPGLHSMEDDNEDENGDEDESVDGSVDDAQSMRSVRSAVSSRSGRKPRQKAKKNSHRRCMSPVRGPRGSRLLSGSSNSSMLSGSSGGMFAGVPFTANAQVLQQRLEELWRVLDFPFGSKLTMLEKYAEPAVDGDTLAQALRHWESAAEFVVVREKLRHVVDEFEELGTVKASSFLSPGEWSYLLMQGIEIPPNAIALGPAGLVEWIHTHLESVTHRCEKVAQQLKASTGDELVYQGQRYPPRV